MPSSRGSQAQSPSPTTPGMLQHRRCSGTASIGNRDQTAITPSSSVGQLFNGHSDTVHRNYGNDDTMSNATAGGPGFRNIKHSHTLAREPLYAPMASRAIE